MEWERRLAGKDDFMNGNDMLNTITDVDDKHILAAEKKRAPRKRIFIGAVSAVAAAAVIVASVGIIGRVNKNKPVPIDENLPILNIQSFNANPGVGGMGGGGSSEIPEDGNPWTEEMNFRTLPVYHSATVNPDTEVMKQKLKETAEALGYDFSEMEIDERNILTEEGELKLEEEMKGYNAPDEEIERMKRISRVHSNILAENDDLYMSIDSAYNIHIVWRDRENVTDTGLVIPDEYKPLSNDDEKLQTAGDYMLKTYPDLFGITDPVYNRYGEYDQSIKYYNDGSDEEKFLNYSFNSAYICFNDEGNVHVINIDTDDGLEKLGDYPIISVDDAKKLLYNGNYITRDRNIELKGDEKIAKISLEYMTGIGYEYVMPYYRVILEVPYSQIGIIEDEGVSYCSFYVPAVDGKYIANMPSVLMFNGAVADSNDNGGDTDSHDPGGITQPAVNPGQVGVPGEEQTMPANENFDLGITTDEPTFIYGLDNQPVRTTDITRILDVTDTPVTIDKLTPDSEGMKVFCDGFQYFKEPISIAYNSYENPEMFDDWYNGETPDNANGYRRINVGDEICGLTLKKATSEFIIYHDYFLKVGSYFFPEYVNGQPVAEFEGTVTLKGFLRAEPHTYYDKEGGQLSFYPCEDVLPLMGTDMGLEYYTYYWGCKVYGNEENSQDSIFTFNEIDEIALGGLDCHDVEGMKPGDIMFVNAVIRDPIYCDSFSIGATLESVEVLSDVLAHEEDLMVAPHN